MRHLKHEQTWKWVMSFIFLASALTVSSNFAYSKYGYILFGIGHLMGMHIFWRYKDHAMFWNNFVFLSIDLWGVYRWFV